MLLSVEEMASLVYERENYIAEVMGSNPVNGLNFFSSGLNFTICLSLCITAMINHIFVSFSSAQIYEILYIHLHKVKNTQLLT